MLPLDPVTPRTPPSSRASDLLPPPDPQRTDGFRIRGFSAADQPACRGLYVDGLLGGKLADNDTGFDVDDIATAYVAKRGSHFWIAETSEGQVIGMIGVQQHEEGVGEIRRLRVAPDHRRRGVGSALVEAAVAFCHEEGYLKVTLDTFVDHEPSVKLFEKFHFRHSRTKLVGDKEMRYFYLDLYESEQRAND